MIKVNIMTKLLFLLVTMFFAAQPFIGRAFSAEEITIPEGLEGYELTGEERRCIRLRGIRDTDVIDNQHVVFHVGGRSYLNKLRQECPRLKVKDSFTYTTSQARLCSIDLISVVDNNLLATTGFQFVGANLTGLAVGPTCTLGDFAELREIEVDKDGVLEPTPEQADEEDGNWYVPPKDDPAP